MSENELYQEIEIAIIKWSNDGTQTAGTLTREIINILNKSKTPIHDSDFMYNWITNHSGRNKQDK